MSYNYNKENEEHIRGLDLLRGLSCYFIVVCHYFAFSYDHIFSEYLSLIFVEFFFVLSGFILALPFARHYIKFTKKVNLKSYFYRRLTRLEPPYIILMTVLCVAYVYSDRIQITEAINSFLASLVYSHNIIFNSPSFINVVAWSLEIEIQFYILVPILSLLFSVKNKNKRSNKR